MKTMKKASIVALVLVGIVFLAVIVGTIARRSLSVSTGRYLEAKNGVAMLVLDNSPIQMSNRTKRDLFDGFDIGDEILVIHDGIQETYPGKTGVYAVFKRGEGTAGDIPQNVVDTLTELGWLESRK